MKFLIVLTIFCHAFLFGVTQDFASETRINEILSQLPAQLKENGEKAKRDIREAIQISKNNGNYKQGQLCYWMGESLLNYSEYDSAGQFYQRAIVFLEKEQDELILGRAYIGAGYILNFQTRYVDALALDLKAEKIFRKIGDRKMLARSLKRIGDDIFYQDESRANAARPYFEESIAISEAEKDTLNIIRGLNSVAGVYSAENEYGLIDEAMKRAIALAEKIKCIRCLAISYSQWGISKHEQGNYQEAIRLYRKEFEMNKKLGAEYDQFFVYQNIAEALNGLKRFDESLRFSDSSLRIAETDVAWNHYRDAYKARYTAYKGKGNFRNTLMAFEKQHQPHHSMLISQARIQR